MKYLIGFLLVFLSFQKSKAQELHIKSRKANAVGGREFAQSIADTALTLKQREKLIFREIKRGNVPDFLRKLKKTEINSGWDMGEIKLSATIYVLPDYFCIGSNDDFFYVPMTPVLAQKVADLTNCSLPTKKLVDSIYAKATIQLAPKPIPPTKEMTTIPVFIAHNDSVNAQLKPYLKNHNLGELTAGSKKDIMISNKIYIEKTAKVVIYGWHQLNGKPIQPVYNKHTNMWADYSHGVRLVQEKVFLSDNGEITETTFKDILKSATKSYLLSDEGIIKKAFYPKTEYSQH